MIARYSWPPELGPEPCFSSRCVAERLDTGLRRIELLLQVENKRLIERELSRMTKATAFLRANFPPAALARGPVTR